MTQVAGDGAVPAGNRHSVWLGLGLIVWIAALRWPFFLYEPTGPDEGLYLAAAVRMLAGARLYTDVWDNKPAGIYLVYTAIAATLGHSRAALNLASALAVLASSLLLYLIGRDATGRKLPGIIAAFVLPAYMLDLGADGANTETFMMVLQVAVGVAARCRCRVAQAVGGSLRAWRSGVRPVAGRAAATEISVGVRNRGARARARRHRLVRTAQHRCPDQTRRGARGGYLLCTLIVFGYFAATQIDDMVFATLISPRLYAAPFGMAEPLHAIDLTIRRSSYFVVLILSGLWFMFDWLRRGRTGVAGKPVLLLGAWVIGAP